MPSTNRGGEEPELPSELRVHREGGRMYKWLQAWSGETLCCVDPAAGHCPMCGALALSRLLSTSCLVSEQWRLSETHL